ncbi:MAG TPA: TIGR02147 family protein [bacterium]|nr:TIGR02147 family protein [bacterium]
MVSVYSYLNYRDYLRDRFAELKKQRLGFSYRSFNRLAGIKSSAFLKLVMDRKRNLAQGGIESIVKGFGLSVKERRYFELLVAFNQASTNEEKDRYFREIVGDRRFRAAKPLAASQFLLYSHWHCVAILEALRLETSEPRNLRWLQELLHPPVGRKQIKRAVAELKKIGLIRLLRSGELKRLDPMLTTEDEVRSVLVANFHARMSQLAAESVMRDGAADREFSALTVALSEADFRRAKTEIQKFRRKLHSILEQGQVGSKTLVAHLNIQLFKLTRAGRRR